MARTRSWWNGTRRKRQLLRTLAKSSRYVKDKLTQLLMLPPPARLLTVLALLVLIGLCAGCATLSTPPSVMPANPSLPPPQQSQPTEPYLNRVQRNIELWEKRLRDTLGIH